MLDESPNETNTTVASQRLPNTLFSKVSDVQESRLAGYHVVYSRSGATDNASGFYAVSPITKSQPRSDAASRDAIRRGLYEAKQEVETMVASAREGDLMELSSAGFRLKETLRQLWGFRNEREEDWGDLLNLLQGVLEQVEFEQFKVEQCAVIRRIICDELGDGIVDIEELERSISALRRAGFDPWRGISGQV
ncbi:MAG: hypothetical protein L0387_12665 [Acidobacteria bacterium]|nr:hypothetical protein [Acidobacteriota bacterium]MCI0718541.1 hypothetical protein [Acidobacteriota bacterium]